jgi:uncharacterized protein (UPF0261 family)
LQKLEETLPINLSAHRIDCDINDAAFADKVLKIFDDWRASGLVL